MKRKEFVLQLCHWCVNSLCFQMNICEHRLPPKGIMPQEQDSGDVWLGHEPRCCQMVARPAEGWGSSGFRGTPGLQWPQSLKLPPEPWVAKHCWCHSRKASLQFRRDLWVQPISLPVGSSLPMFLAKALAFKKLRESALTYASIPWEGILWTFIWGPVPGLYGLKIFICSHPSPFIIVRSLVWIFANVHPWSDFKHQAWGLFFFFLLFLF